MANDLFVPRADLVDDGFWLETRQTFETTTALWRLLDVARREPMPWVPRMVLCGEGGVGKSAIAQRFVSAARRSVACHLVNERVANLDAEQARRDQAARASAQVWAEDMVRNNGVCQLLCSPAAWIPESMLARVFEDAQRCDPVQMLDMTLSDQTGLGFFPPRAWRSPGNDARDPMRRTSLAFVDNADRMLRVTKAKRLWCLDRMEKYGGSAGHRILNVYIGSAELAEALAECGSTQVIPLRPMACDPEFAKVVEMVFGPVGTEETQMLHRATGGRMGPLLHGAAMRGLAPPYAVPHAEIRRLPAPASPRPKGRRP